MSTGSSTSAPANTPPPSTPADGATLEERWQAPLSVRACFRCQQRLLMMADPQGRRCPWCGEESLTDAPAEGAEVAPEKVVPFTVDRAAAERELQRAVARMPRWRRPSDLSARRLMARLTAVYLPAWLVDSRVQARWHGEVGFDYDVKTHREVFQGGSWRSQEVKRTHIDWEPRAGTLDRKIDNVQAPALMAWDGLHQALGGFNVALEEDYRPDLLLRSPGGHASVVLPNLSSDQAWRQAHRGLVQQVRALILKACGGQHLERLDLEEQPLDAHWTLRLLPVWTTWYRGDNGELVVLRLSGQSGRAVGRVLASKTKATRAALSVGAIALAALTVSIIAPRLPGGLGLLMHAVTLLGGVTAPVLYQAGSKHVTLTKT